MTGGRTRCCKDTCTSCTVGSLSFRAKEDGRAASTRANRDCHQLITIPNQGILKSTAAVPSNPSSMIQFPDLDGFVEACAASQGIRPSDLVYRLLMQLATAASNKPWVSRSAYVMLLL